MHQEARKSVLIPCVILELCFDLYCVCGFRFLFESDVRAESVVWQTQLTPPFLIRSYKIYFKK